MNNGSGILTAIGLGSVDIGIFIIIVYILLIVMITLLIITIVKMNGLKGRYDKFMMGSKAVSLEGEIQQLAENVNALIENDQTNADDIKELYRKHRKVFQKMGLVKYDAFNEMGGKLSFCLTLLDEDDNGIIMNTVHSSSGCYSYTKDIKKGRCDIELSAEETQALKQALS